MKRWKLLAAVLALCVGVTGSIWAQDHDRDDNARRDNDRVTQRDHDREKDHDRDDRRARDRDRDDQNAYRQRNDRDRDDGYYRQRNDRDRDDEYYGRGGYGAYGNGAHGRYGNRDYNNLAYQTGYRDGMLDGQHDFQSRRNYQPERDDNYKHGDRGYNSGLGDKNAYKQDYRNGYLEGYRSAYGRSGY